MVELEEEVGKQRTQSEQTIASLQQQVCTRILLDGLTSLKKNLTFLICLSHSFFGCICKFISVKVDGYLSASLNGVRLHVNQFAFSFNVYLIRNILYIQLYF